MNIIFSWHSTKIYGKSKFELGCQTNDVQAGFKDCISSFLCDDEGLGLQYLSAWIEEGNKKISLVKNSELMIFDWIGKAWSAKVSRDAVKIYWDYDDTEYFDVMSFESFEKIVRAWSEFITSPPDVEKTKIVNFS